MTQKDLATDIAVIKKRNKKYKYQHFKTGKGY